jgi:putative transposase
VVSWELDQTLELPFVLTAVQRALGQAVPLICNSDQGSHFTSPQYCQLLQAANVQISMDGKGRALDNIFTTRLWRTVKYEEVNLHDYRSPREARQALMRYFQFYNQERPHQALDDQTPAEVYFRGGSAGAAASNRGSGENKLMKEQKSEQKDPSSTFGLWAASGAQG